jgi:hypothetical protein
MKKEGLAKDTRRSQDFLRGLRETGKALSDHRSNALRYLNFFDGASIPGVSVPEYVASLHQNVKHLLHEVRVPFRSSVH